jgi:hypothetical protein
MKQSVPPGVIAGIAVVVVLLLGYLVYKNFLKGPDYSNGLSPTENKKVLDSQAKDMGRSIMGTPSGSASPRMQGGNR